jgi:hypothetical protein
MKLETTEEVGHVVWAGGRRWVIPSVALTRMPDGTFGLSLAELGRVHKAVANAICSTASPLTPDELELLCAITDTTFTEVADRAHLDKSSVTKWRRRGNPLPWVLSLHLKKWFWFKLFGDALGGGTIPLRELSSDGELLRLVGGLAIERNLTTPVREVQAEAA